MLRDKDTSSMAGILSPCVDEIITVPPDSPRALSQDALAEQFRAVTGKPVCACGSIRRGVEQAMENAAAHHGVVCAAGSLYLAGAVRSCFFPVD
jgi:folylpolyglutamate synthase/dihydropteroate synthase